MGSLGDPGLSLQIPRARATQGWVWIVGLGTGLLSFPLFPFSCIVLCQPQTAFPDLAQKSPAATFPGEEVGSV